MADDLEYLRALLSAAEKSYTQGHEFAAKSQEHSDAMLTWAIGLMGGGLYASYGLLNGAPTRMWMWALMPWIAGILCALGGRLLLGKIMAFGMLGAQARVSRVQLLLLETNVALIQKNFRELTENAALFDGEKKSVTLQRPAQILYLVTHLLFALGVVAVAIAVAVYGTRKV